MREANTANGEAPVPRPDHAMHPALDMPTDTAADNPDRLEHVDDDVDVDDNVDDDDDDDEDEDDVHDHFAHIDVHHDTAPSAAHLFQLQLQQPSTAALMTFSRHLQRSTAMFVPFYHQFGAADFDDE